MPLHGVSRLRHFVRADRMQDLLVLALEDLEMRAIGRWRRGAPHRAPRDDKASEIFQKALELRIAGGVGDGAMEREILIDSVFAAVDCRADRGKAVGDLFDVCGR